MWSRYRKVAIDSNCFIYLIEGSAYVEQLMELFQQIEQGKLEAVTSILTYTEVLTDPYRTKDIKLIEEYRMTLRHFPNLRFRQMDLPIADRSAQYRVQYGLKTPDAVQLATAAIEEADVFITNDHDFKKVDFPVLFL
jgi:predicted nucleic acid-binding protein